MQIKLHAGTSVRVGGQTLRLVDDTEVEIVQVPERRGHVGYVMSTKGLKEGCAHRMVRDGESQLKCEDCGGTASIWPPRPLAPASWLVGPRVGWLVSCFAGLSLAALSYMLVRELLRWLGIDYLIL